MVKIKKKRLPEGTLVLKSKVCVPDLIFDIIKWLFLAILFALCLIPFINILSVSFSTAGFEIYLTPRGLTLRSYKTIFASSEIFRSFGMSVAITVSVVVISTILMALAAFPLSKPDFPFRKFFLIFYIVTMLFGAGIVPSLALYLLLGIYDTFIALVLPLTINVYNMLLMKTFFENMPQELEEAAKIDGANEFQMFFRVIIPLAVPILASCVFFTAVGTWNNYSSALYFAPMNTQIRPLAFYIYKIVDGKKEASHIGSEWALNEEAVTVILAIIPILCIYPFVMRYFKTGLMIGSTKG